MGQGFKQAIRGLVPPLVLAAYNSFAGRGIAFKGNYSSWDEAARRSSGYGSDLILEKVTCSSLKVKQGQAVFERDSVLFDKIDHSFPVLAALLRAAVEHNGTLSVLDFGGSLGSSYRQCREFLSVVGNLRWSIVEQANFVRAGKNHFQDDVLRFYDSAEECCRVEQPNVILLSSVLQYLEKPYAVIDALTTLGIDYIIVDRTPIGDLNEDRLTVQEVPASIYRGSYPAWIFDEQRLLAGFLRNYALLTDFDANEPALGHGAFRVRFRGFVFEKNG